MRPGYAPAVLGLQWTGRVRQLAIFLLVASVVAGILGAWRGWPVVELLGLRPSALVGREGLPMVWQAFTYPWIALGAFDVVFSVLALGWFVGDLERAWGDRLFLDRLVLLWLGVTAGSLLLAAAYPPIREARWIGPSPFLEGLVVAWGFTFPDRTIRIFFFFPVRGLVFAWLTLGLTVLTPVFGGPETLVGVAPYLCAVGMGYLFGRTPFSLRRLWLRLEERRLRRAIDRERNQRLH